MAKKVKHYDISEIMNTIICGDTIEELKKIEDESVDLIFADPPYFMQTEGELHRTDGSKSNGVEDEWDKFSGYNEYDKFFSRTNSSCKSRISFGQGKTVACI